MTRARSFDSRARSVAQISGSTSWGNVISAHTSYASTARPAKAHGRVT